MKDEIEDRLEKNLSRVKNLVGIFENSAHKGTRKVTDTDILRAATVFLHATLEDFLRSIAAWKLPLAPAEKLEDIPLAGMRKQSKFSLGDLADHRNKRVDELIKLSVEEHLERSNYSNTTEIATLLKGIGITIEKVKSSFTDVSKLMERRHQIVHRVDRKLTTGKAAHLTKDDVNCWIGAVQKFTSNVLGEIPA